MNSMIDFFIYEFICFMNSCMNSGVPRFQMIELVTGYRIFRKTSTRIAKWFLRVSEALHGLT